MKKRGYEQSVQREDSSVYDDGEDGGMLSTSRDAAVRAKAYEGKQPHPARWVCATIFCTLFVVILAIWAGSSTDAGRAVLTRMAQPGAADFKEYVWLLLEESRSGSLSLSMLSTLSLSTNCSIRQTAERLASFRSKSLCRLRAQNDWFACALICTPGTTLSLSIARLTQHHSPKISAATCAI